MGGSPVEGCQRYSVQELIPAEFVPGADPEEVDEWGAARERLA
jgi:hypothetical protein